MGRAGRRPLPEGEPIVVYQRAEAGLLPCIRVGGLLRFRPISVREIANEGAPQPKRAAGASPDSKKR